MTRFGLYLSTPDDWEAVDRLETMIEMAVRAEIASFAVVVAGQHYGESPQHLLQPVPLMARLSAEVSSIRLATGVLLGSLLNPYEIAEDLSTLDVISRGRAVLGIGAGHRPEESVAFGKDFRRRGTSLEECVTIIRLLWGKALFGAPPALDFGLGLQPLQGPDIPIWLAATSDVGVRRAARVGDTWYVGPGTSLDGLDRQLGIYREELARLGRPLPDLMPVRRDVFLTDSRRTHAMLASSLERRFVYRTASGYLRALPVQDQGVTDVSTGEVDDWPRGASDIICGTPEQCRVQLGRLAGRLPSEALFVLRIGWADWGRRELVEHVDALADVVRPLTQSACV